MSYEKFCATWRRLREECKGDPAAEAVIEEFGRTVAYLRTLDERSAMLQAELAIEKIQRGVPPASE